MQIRKDKWNNLCKEWGKNMGATKISKGIYEYKGYRISNCGYHHPDHCIWWEAVDVKTGCADYHSQNISTNINRVC